MSMTYCNIVLKSAATSASSHRILNWWRIGRPLQINRTHVLCVCVGARQRKGPNTAGGVTICLQVLLKASAELLQSPGNSDLQEEEDDYIANT